MDNAKMFVNLDSTQELIYPISRLSATESEETSFDSQKLFHIPNFDFTQELEYPTSSSCSSSCSSAAESDSEDSLPDI